MNAHANVLVVDDDPGVLDVVAFTLRREGFEVDEQTDGAAGLEAARAQSYDIVILDVMLPGLSGTDVCRALRAESDVPILMLTARDAEIDRVLGLELGADAVSYTHLRAHETVLDLVCRLLLEKKKQNNNKKLNLTK